MINHELALLSTWYQYNNKFSTKQKIAQFSLLLLGEKVACFNQILNTCSSVWETG